MISVWILLLLACAYNAEVAAAEINCREVARAIMDFRDFYFGLVPEREQIKTVLVYTGVNLLQYKLIEDLICNVLMQDTDSSWTHTSLPLLTVPQGEQNLYAYTALVEWMHQALNAAEERAAFKRRQDSEILRIYNLIGYPNFPLGLNRYEIEEILNLFKFEHVKAAFPLYTDQEGAYGSDIHRPTARYEYYYNLRDDLSDARSLTDFVRLVLQSRYVMTPEILESEAQLILDYTEDLHKNVSQAENAINDFREIINGSGLLHIHVDRAPLYTCDFLDDTAAEALGYIVEMFGKKEVQRVVNRYIGVDFLVTDVHAFRSFVCDVMSSKTQEELIEKLPQTWIDSSDLFLHKYGIGNLTHFMYLLNNPREMLAMAVSYIDLVKAAERVDFPHFPLYMTNSHAKQLAYMILQVFPEEYLSVERLAQALLDATSLSQALANYHHVLRKLDDLCTMLSGKTEMVELLTYSVYETVMNAQEHGLFLLFLDTTYI